MSTVQENGIGTNHTRPPVGIVRGQKDANAMKEICIYDNYPRKGCPLSDHIYSLRPLDVGIVEPFIISMPESVFCAAAPLESALRMDARGMPVLMWEDSEGSHSFHPSTYGVAWA